MNTAKDLWEIFALGGSGAAQPALTPEEMQELDADLAHRDRLKQILDSEEAKAEASRHDW